MAQIPIYTVGYGVRSKEDFLALLERYGIQYLIDIRSRPYSNYKPEFSRDALEAWINEAGLRYVYMGDVIGGQPRQSKYYGEKGEVIYELYRDDPAYKRGISRLRKAWQQQNPVAIMCSEGDPRSCHRSKMIGQTLSAEGIGVLHIDENGEPKTQQEIELDLTKGQLSLFPPAFTSRSKGKPNKDS